MKVHLKKLSMLHSKFKTQLEYIKNFRKLFTNDIAIDLGTANTVVYVPGRGIVLNEPSVVAVKVNSTMVLSAGSSARDMLGRTPETIMACRPLRDGVIANFELAEKMLRFFIKKVPSDKNVLVKPRMVIGVPSGITQVERRAVIDSAKQAGARVAKTIIEPMAAAIGANLPVEDPCASLIVDIGGGTTEVAVISLKAVVFCRSIRIAGDEMDRAIVNYVRHKHNLMIGERTAEKMKIEHAYALIDDDSAKETFEVKGRDVVSGVPRTILFSASEINEALQETLGSIVDVVKMALENTPPELASDLVDRGITLAGGGALLKDLDKLFARETGLPVVVADDPLFCVVKGVGKVLEQYNLYEDALS